MGSLISKLSFNHLPSKLFLFFGPKGLRLWRTLWKKDKNTYHLVVLYQNTSNYGPGVEISPLLWGLGFHIQIKKENFKNLLVSNHKGKSFHILHVASSSGPLPKYYTLWP